MAGAYIDTSVLGRVLLAEPDSQAIVLALADFDAWWSSELLLVELRRLAAREGLGPAGERLLGGIALVPITAAALQRAAAIEPLNVRSLDAIHLEAAVGLHAQGDVTAVFTYDRQLQAGCTHHGVAVVAPR
jgi:predicted nucleic acid-binding protein